MNISISETRSSYRIAKCQLLHDETDLKEHRDFILKLIEILKLLRVVTMQVTI